VTTKLAKSVTSLPAMPMKAIEEPAAWRGRNLGNARDFTHQLTEAEVAEIDAVVQATMQARIRDRNCVPCSRSQFQQKKLRYVAVEFGRALTLAY
jgi:hypothetical protein